MAMRVPSTPISKDSFFVRVKLDSEETARRLRSLHKKMHFPRSQTVSLVRMVDWDRELEYELFLVEQQIQATVELLDTQRVDEREYMAGGVLAIEAAFLRLRSLLNELNRYVQYKRHIPTGYYLRAAALVADFKSKRTVLRKLRAAFDEEFVSPQEQPRGVLDWIARGLVRLADCFHVPVTQRQEHRHMEHIVSGDFCRCKEYV